MTTKIRVLISLLIFITTTSLCPLHSKQYNQDSEDIVDHKTKEFSSKYNYEGLFGGSQRFPYQGRFKNLVTTDSISFETNCKKIVNYIQQFYHLGNKISFVRNPDAPNGYGWHHRIYNDSIRFYCNIGLLGYYNGFLIQKQPLYQSHESSISQQEIEGAGLGITYCSWDKSYSINYDIFQFRIKPPNPKITRQQAFEKVKKIAYQDYKAKNPDNADSDSLWTDLLKDLYFDQQCLYVYHDNKDRIKYTYTYEFDTVKKINQNGSVHVYHSAGVETLAGVSNRNKYLINAVTGALVDPKTINLKPYKWKDR